MTEEKQQKQERISEAISSPEVSWLCAHCFRFAQTEEVSNFVGKPSSNESDNGVVQFQK